MFRWSLSFTLAMAWACSAKLDTVVEKTCADQTAEEADELVAFWALSRGPWEHCSEAFRAALQSKSVSVRMFTVRKLIHRLFVEGPHLAGREATLESLKAWMVELHPEMRTFLGGLVLASERGDEKAPRMAWQGCPKKGWPHDARSLRADTRKLALPNR